MNLSPLVRLAPALAALALAAAPATRAQEPTPPRTWTLDLAFGPALLGGNTTYRIEASDPTGSMASELEFPLGGGAAALRAELATRDASHEDRLVFQLTAIKSVAGTMGTLKDSDWISGPAEVAFIGSNHDGLDIYSESDANLDALVVNARAAWELRAGTSFTVAPMLGIQYQRFAFDVSNVRQVGYGPYAASFTGSSPGKVLDYEVSYRAPYAGAGAEYALAGLTLTADAWFSPAAAASDRDDHLLRKKVSTTDATGNAWQAAVGARLAFGPDDLLEAQLSTIRFHTTGTQHQVFYDGSGMQGFVGSTITSTRNTLLLSYSHRFQL